MKLGYFFSVCSVCLVLSACGKSGSNNNDANQLKTQEQTLADYCGTYPNAQECATYNNQANNLGMNNFNYNTNYVGTSGGNGGYGGYGSTTVVNPNCGSCPAGQRAIVWKGVRRCESASIYQSVSSNQVSMRYVSKSNGRHKNKEKLWVSFDGANAESYQAINSNVQGGYAQPTCAQQTQVYGARCICDDDCQGYGVPSTCQQIGPNVQYGFCQQVGGYGSASGGFTF